MPPSEGSAGGPEASSAPAPRPEPPAPGLAGAGARERQRTVDGKPVPLAARLLGRLFDGERGRTLLEAGGPPPPAGPGARGYAALATETLRALSRVRGLPARGERPELLRQLGPGGAPRPPEAPEGSGCTRRGAAAPGPRPRARGGAAVERVLEDAVRLSREVAQVQRQFQEQKRAVLARGAEAGTLLDDIAAAGGGAKRCRRG